MAATEKMRQALEDHDPVGLGRIEPNTNRLLLSPSITSPSARAYVERFHAHPDRPTIVSHHGEIRTWRDGQYHATTDANLRHAILPLLHDAVCIKDERGAARVVPFPANPTSTNAVLETVRTMTHIDDGISAPAWLDGRTDPAAGEMLAHRDGLLHIPTQRCYPPSPAFYTNSAVGFAYDPSAPRPQRFEQLLDEMLGDDQESRDTLGEAFGYYLTGDTSLQKILLMVGPTRSGKGTIARVLRELVGPANVANPTTSSLAGPFGLQPLLNKPLAIVSDARFHGEATAIAIERLLCISGEDPLTVERKFLPALHLKMPTRFMFLTNELPRLTDASAAIAGRFIVLRLTRSFYGSEDPQLTGKLLAELPGILLWALEGWRRLYARGHFVQPSSAAEALQDLADLASPVGAFVREECVVGAGFRIEVDHLYRAWKAWGEQEGRTGAGTKQAFGKSLAAAVPGIKRRRGTDQAPFYEGISIKGARP